MTAVPQETYITEAEYEASEANSPVKREYFEGRVYAMAGARRVHVEVCGNAYFALRTRLGQGGCLPRNSDQRIKVEATGLQAYPDISVSCPGSRFEGNGEVILLDPVLLIEVLSPTTSDIDRGDKLVHYMTIASLRQYLIVDPTRIWVEHWWRADDGKWASERYFHKNDVLHLSGLGIELPVSELYTGLDVSDGLFLTPRPVHENAE